ncbi:hypothetical protein [Streptoalloteichus hindustanus]|uniref:PE family protein n=1 Tax=Streptoalloteichus hindustanus TaxID=2017 RepID=A0A1M4Z2F6_STRHI|nr:hypothetical protein [Streptoalloteichus hindustanus]SHF12190.1 hypothetical protein SAMN05444320_102576 [Streptoalloteichus hindustanus]
MDVENSNSMPLSGGWQVEPERVRAFAQAVAQVRADFEALRADAEELMNPANQPRMGTSPVGLALTDKFTDRLGGTEGLLEQLAVALGRMNEFIESAESSAARYTHEDTTAADSLRTT